MSPPVLIFTHGAWHPSQSFNKVIPKLEATGYKCISLSLPAVGRDPPVKDLSEDITAVRDPVIKEIDAGNDVAVICHSWSGLVVASALEGLGKGEGAHNGQKNGVVRIIFIAAFMQPRGVSLYEAMGSRITPLWNIQGDILYANDPIDAFYHDLDKTEAEYWASQLKSHSLATFYAKSTGEAHLKIPSSYLLCEDDRAIPAVAQEGMVKQAQDGGAVIKLERTGGSHSPFLTKPDVIVDFIRRSIES